LGHAISAAVNAVSARANNAAKTAGAVIAAVFITVFFITDTPLRLSPAGRRPMAD
jgi:hypothetical protein